MVHCRSPRDPDSFNDLAARVSKLLEVQEARLQKVIDWPDSSDVSSSPGMYRFGPIAEKCGSKFPGPSKKKPSFERKRPTTDRVKTAPQPKQNPRPKPKARRTSMEPGWGYSRPPPAPEVPISDTSTDYSTDSFRSSVSHGATTNHWIRKVFERSPPSTGLSETGQPFVINLLHA